jgi:hypothetical protein
MKILYKWEDCSRFEPCSDAYYLEIPKHEISNELYDLLSKGGESLKIDNEYFDEVNHFAKGKMTHGLANENCVYVLINKNLTKAILCDVYYPYSGQWGAYCPFKYLYKSNIEVDEYLKNAIEINKLEDIKFINENALYNVDG